MRSIGFVQRQNGAIPDGLVEDRRFDRVEGATPLVVAEGVRIAGVVVLEDILSRDEGTIRAPAQHGTSHGDDHRGTIH